MRRRPFSLMSLTKRSPGGDVTDPTEVFTYVGDWDKAKTLTSPKDSFHIYGYDLNSGALDAITSMIPGVKIGATCVDVQRRILYCTDEDSTHPGYEHGGGGLVYAFAIDADTGRLTEINHQPSYGTLPSYCAVDSAGEYLILTNHTTAVPATRAIRDASGEFRIALEYDAANLVLFPLGDDGSIGKPCDIYTATGDGGPLPHQSHPMLHSISLAPSGKSFAICDKGCDRIMTFTIDRQARKLVLLASYAAIPGSSPRYSSVHPSRPFLFVNYEMKAIVESFRYHDDGTLESICTASALPEGVEDNLGMKQSDIKIDHLGRYLYDLLRGPNAVSVFAIDQKNGSIENIQTVTLEGTMPRGCAISPDGRFLLVAMQMSDEVLILEIGGDGRLTPTGRRLGLPQQSRPGTVTFFPPVLAGSQE
jgi:6-phosphogluconolactonase